MDRLVLDTNVVISAALSPSGPPARVLERVLDRSAELAISPEVLEEYRSVLSRSEFGFAPGRADELIEDIVRVALDVVPSQAIKVCSDPEDDMFIECAFAAGANFVVTGNRRHFPATFADIRIVSPAAYLRLIA